MSDPISAFSASAFHVHCPTNRSSLSIREGEEYLNVKYIYVRGRTVKKFGNSIFYYERSQVHLREDENPSSGSKIVMTTKNIISYKYKNLKFSFC